MLPATVLVGVGTRNALGDQLPKMWAERRAHNWTYQVDHRLDQDSRLNGGGGGGCSVLFIMVSRILHARLCDVITMPSSSKSEDEVIWLIINMTLNVLTTSTSQ